MEDAPRDADALRHAPAAAQAAPPKEHPSDIVAITDDDEDLDPRRAYEVLEIRTPLEEFEAYVKARIDTLVRLGEQEKAELTSEAMELGRKALARVTGASLPEGAAKGARP